MMALRDSFMPSTRTWSQASTFPWTTTGFSNVTFSPPECISVMVVGSEKVTDDRESKSPDWKWGCTAVGLDPKLRISSRVGSDTK